MKVVILGVLVLTLVFVSYVAVIPLFATPQPNPILDANDAAIQKFRNHAASLATVTPAEPGSLAVYRKIDAMTDCRELQATFEKNVYDAEGRGTDTFLGKVTLSYATHAFDRMKELDC